MPGTEQTHIIIPDKIKPMLLVSTVSPSHGPVSDSASRAGLGLFSQGGETTGLISWSGGTLVSWTEHHGEQRTGGRQKVDLSLQLRWEPKGSNFRLLDSRHYTWVCHLFAYHPSGLSGPTVLPRPPGFHITVWSFPGEIFSTPSSSSPRFSCPPPGR